MRRKRSSATAGDALLQLMHAIVAGDAENVARLVAEAPGLVRAQAEFGASRADPATYFFDDIQHHAYAGDTALHIAAAGFQKDILRNLIAAGADCAAKNRRGAEPLHYAADANTWKPTAQAATIRRLIRAGANPNGTDKGGVSPLHRAARTRSAAAVRALLAGGADPRARNKSGSTALHLAVQNTGRGGSGTARAVAQQRQIIRLLLQFGAEPSDTDGQGKSVHDVATAGWVRGLLRP